MWEHDRKISAWLLRQLKNNNPKLWFEMGLNCKNSSRIETSEEQMQLQNEQRASRGYQQFVSIHRTEVGCHVVR